MLNQGLVVQSSLVLAAVKIATNFPFKTNHIGLLINHLLINTVKRETKTNLSTNILVKVLKAKTRFDCT